MEITIFHSFPVTPKKKKEVDVRPLRHSMMSFDERLATPHNLAVVCFSAVQGNYAFPFILQCVCVTIDGDLPAMQGGRCQSVDEMNNCCLSMRA